MSDDGFKYSRPYMTPHGIKHVTLNRCKCEHQTINNHERVCGQCGNAIPSLAEYERNFKFIKDPFSYQYVDKKKAKEVKGE